MITFKKAIAAAGITTALMFAAPFAQAEMMKFTTILNGASGVPPAETTATGSAEVSVDTDAKKVTWTVKVDGLSGDATAAHIHGPASVTEKAAPVIDMSAGIMQGSGDITDAQIAELKAGKYYLNVHTAKFPDGEIRGQLAVAP